MSEDFPNVPYQSPPAEQEAQEASPNGATPPPSPPASTLEDPLEVLLRELARSRSELEEMNMRLTSLQFELLALAGLILSAAMVAVKLAQGGGSE